ncbi:TPA: hypothetical protein ACOTHR_003598 [Clostridium perfringens]
MKKKFLSLIFTSCILSTILVATPIKATNVYANEIKKGNIENFSGYLSKDVLKTIDEFNRLKAMNRNSNDIKFSIKDNPTIQEINYFNNLSKKELIDFLEKEYNNALNITYRVESIEDETSSLARATYRNRKARVWFGVPAIGHCWMNILYDASLDSKKYFTSGKVNDSWLTGTRLGFWDHKYGEFNVAYYRTFADVIAHGVLTYGIPNTPVSVSTNQSVLFQDSYRNY